MRVIRKYNQSRRDCTIDMECEGCSGKATDDSAYDDRNFWDNVIPCRKCKQCGKSSKDLGTKPERISTKYADGEIV